MTYAMDMETRQGFAETGVSIITGEVTEEMVHNAMKKTLLAAGVTGIDPFIMDLLARYHYNLSIREATIAAMIETIEELEN